MENTNQDNKKTPYPEEYRFYVTSLILCQVPDGHEKVTDRCARIFMYLENYLQYRKDDFFFKLLPDIIANVLCSKCFPYTNTHCSLPIHSRKLYKML